ncbi:MAG: hypothetical protein AAF943_03475 [Pseudomonadota bacterium]
MKISERLNNVRLAFPECDTVAYADISTQTVLSSSAPDGLRQEHLNDLCATAAGMFADPSSKELADLLAPAKGEAAAGEVYQVILMDAREVGIFLRSVSNPNDALCCLCDPSIDIAAFLPAVRLQLEEIGQDS